MQNSQSLTTRLQKRVKEIESLFPKRTKELPPDPQAKYRAFQKKYWNHPDRFVRDCFTWEKGDGPAPYQEESLRAIIEKKRVALRGPHGLGKTAFAAWVIWWFALTRDGWDWKLPTTASVWLQVKEFLWPEVHKWAGRIRWDVVGRPPVKEKVELMDLKLVLDTGAAFAAVTGKASSIEGAHAEHVLVVFDEAKAIPDAVFDAIEGAFSTGKEQFALAISTPGDPNGRFFDIQSRKPGYEDWWVRHVTRDECIAAGRMKAAWAIARARQWGVDSAVFINRVLGNFADQKTQNGVIPRLWVQLARARWRAHNERRDLWKRLLGFGIDVAESPDRTFLAPRYEFNGPLIDTLDELPPSIDLMVQSSAIEARTKTWNRWARIDIIGMGAGVYSRCKQLGIRVEAFDARESAEHKTDKTGELKFANMRSWAYWNVRDMLNPAYGVNLALPDDQDLEDELCAHTYHQRESTLYAVVDKKLVRKTLGRSPDRADAVVIALMPPPAPPVSQPGRAPSRQIS